MITEAIGRLDAWLTARVQPLTDYLAWRFGVSNFKIAEAAFCVAALPLLAVLAFDRTRSWLIFIELAVYAVGFRYVTNECRKLDFALLTAFHGGRIINKWRETGRACRLIALFVTLMLLKDIQFDDPWALTMTILKVLYAFIVFLGLQMMTTRHLSQISK